MPDQILRAVLSGQATTTYILESLQNIFNTMYHLRIE